MTDASYVFEQRDWQDVERERLALVARYHDPGTIRALEAVGVSGDWTCLDVAAGSGTITRWLAQRAGRVVATDLETDLLEELRAEGVEVRRHDVLADALEPGRYDLVHTRLLLIHLPERREALRRIVAAARPGGGVVVGDIDFTTLEAHDQWPAWPRLHEAFRGATASAGWDLGCGRRLTGMLEYAGVEGVEAESVARHVRGGSLPCRIMAMTLERMRPLLIDAGASAEDVEDGVRAFLAPSRAFEAPTMWTAWGRAS